MDGNLNGGSISGKIDITGTINGTIQIGGGSEPVLQEVTVTPRRSAFVVEPSEGYDGISKVNVNATSLQLGAIAYPNEEGFVVEPEQGYVGLRRVSVAPCPLQSKTVTPDNTTQHILPDSGYYGLESVDVGAVSSSDNLPAVMFGVNSTPTVASPDANHKTYYGITTVTELTLSDATSIGSEACKNTSLESISAPLVATVGNNAFQNCEYLETVNLPSATAVYDYAFNNCQSLESISLPAVQLIGEYCFERCNNLTDIYLGASSVVTLPSDGGYALQVGNGGDLTVHVPASLLSQYQTDWASYISDVTQLGQTVVLVGDL